MPTIFKNIPDLPVVVTINGADVLELFHAGVNVQVSIDTLSSAIGIGGGQVSSGLTDPVDPPSNTNKVALYFNETTGYGWRWSVKDQAWI